MHCSCFESSLVRFSNNAFIRFAAICVCVFVFICSFTGVAKANIVDSGYLVLYDNFSPQQVNEVMVYATRFQGYEQFEVLYQRSQSTQVHYQSDIDLKLLSYNFERTFADLKWDVIAQQQGNQYHFTFVRVQPKPLPYGVW